MDTIKTGASQNVVISSSIKKLTMTTLLKKYVFKTGGLCILLLALTMGGCKKWEDHTAVTNQDLNQNLLQAISANPDLSKFREYVGKAGLDSLLQASKTFTVWAPNNAALAGIDPAIVADVPQLKKYILNHISNQLYFTRDAAGGKTIRVPMVNGKYNNFTATKLDVAAILTADKFVQNGTLHIIDKAVPPLQNIWEYVNATTTTYNQHAFLVSLNYNFFDPSLAIIDSINQTTGEPIYRPGTGIVVKNYFNDITDLRKEDKQYTYFIIDNAAFNAEAALLNQYFNTGTPSLTDFYSKLDVVIDLAFDTSFAAQANIPATLTSKRGITIPVTQANITKAIKLSNGMAYVVSGLHVANTDRFATKIIQGENPSGFSVLKTANTHYRLRVNPVTGLNFNDIYVAGHATTGFYSHYRMTSPTIKYKVYALAENDFQTAALVQTISAYGYEVNGSTTTYTQMGATFTHNVPLYTAAGAYNEIYLGEITNTKYGTLEWRLTASASTTPIVLDYLKLVPQP